MRKKSIIQQGSDEEKEKVWKEKKKKNAKTPKCLGSLPSQLVLDLSLLGAKKKSY